jgi:S1-C subfamily serine protease
MRQLLQGSAALLLTAGLVAVTLPAPASAAGDGAKVIRTFEKLSPSVVPIRYTLRLLETPEGGQGAKLEGVMCGAVIGSDGLVVTTADIFPDMDGDPRQTFVPVDLRIVPAPGIEFEARAVGLDRTLNLAVLKVKQPALFPVPGARFAARQPRPGEKVLLLGLLGEQYAYAPTFTESRVVSAVEGRGPMYVLDGLIQDLTIGGLVVTLGGEALGIVGEDVLTPPPTGPGDLAGAGNVLSLFSSLSQGQRAGYPMLFPYDGLLDELLADPPPVADSLDTNRGWLGIIMQPLSGELADYWSIEGAGGVVIGAILDGSPAERAGLQVGDVILEVDHAPVEVREQRDLGRFREMVQAVGAGRELPLSVHRNGERQIIPLVLGSRPKTVFLAEEQVDESFGLTVKELTYDFLQAVNLPGDTSGIFVSEIENAGWADVGGLRVSDVIMEIDRREVSSVEDFRQLMADVGEARPDEVVFFIRRGTQTLFVPVTTDW